MFDWTRLGLIIHYFTNKIKRLLSTQKSNNDASKLGDSPRSQSQFSSQSLPMWDQPKVSIFHWAPGFYTSAVFHQVHALFYKIQYDWPPSIQAASRAAQTWEESEVKLRVDFYSCVQKEHKEEGRAAVKYIIANYSFASFRRENKSWWQSAT